MRAGGPPVQQARRRVGASRASARRLSFTMTITHDAPNRRFTVQLEGGSGELQYEELPGGVIEFHHTWVDPPVRKQGTAAELVRAGVAWARARGAKVEPTCPYVRSWFERHPEEQDLLA